VPDDEDDEPAYGGFGEKGEGDLDFAGHLERVRSMSDADLLRAHRVLSNVRVVSDTTWLPMLEAEMELRGLKTSN
jgi:hypothetical protein